MSFFDKIKAFFSGENENDAAEPITRALPSEETLSFNAGDLKNAEERNAQQDTRMTEEYENFLKEQYPQDAPQPPTRDGFSGEESLMNTPEEEFPEYPDDDTLAWDPDYREEEYDQSE